MPALSAELITVARASPACLYSSGQVSTKVTFITKLAATIQMPTRTGVRVSSSA